MALNFSYRPIFEDKSVSSMRITNGYLVDANQEKVEECFDRGRDRVDRCGLHESVSSDILDLLPSDPFGMDMSTTFTAITGWLEDLEVDYGGLRRNDVGTSDGDCQLYAGLNFIWNNAMKFQAFPANVGFDQKLNVDARCGSTFLEENEVKGDEDASFLNFQSEELGASLSHDCDGSACNVDGILTMGNETRGNEDAGFVDFQSEEFDSSLRNDSVISACNVDDNWRLGDEIRGNETMGFVGFQTEKLGEGRGVSLTDDDAPHQALDYVFAYLGVRDLLVVETVCKTMRDTVRSDTLCWKHIHIGRPLNEKITDDILLELTNRALGKLESLTLVECFKITDDGLKRVLEKNGMLTKLCVPGCTRLSIDGIVSSLTAFKNAGAHGVKQLRIGCIYGATQKHFEELKSLLGTDSCAQQNAHKLRFYHRRNMYLSCEDGRQIDIEICPICLDPRIVYDCPGEGCLGKKQTTKVCRACVLCIPRCAKCGICIHDDEYEENFFLELLCLPCGKELFNWREWHDSKIVLSGPPSLNDLSCSARVHG